MNDDQYSQHVTQAMDRGLSDCEAGRTFRHTPLVRRGDARVATLFRSVLWTASARTAVEDIFGEVFTKPGHDTVLEQALDKAAYALAAQPETAQGRSTAGELMLMWGQARVLYRVMSTEVFIIAVVPSAERWSRMSDAS